MAVQCVHSAKVGLPLQLTVEVQAVQAVGVEGSKQKFAVGHRGSGRQARGEMPALVRQGFAHSPFPEDASIAAVKRHDDELDATRDGIFVVAAGTAAVSGRQDVTGKERRR